MDKFTVLYPYTCNIDEKSKKIDELNQLHYSAVQNSEPLEAAKISMRIIELKKFGEPS